MKFVIQNKNEKEHTIGKFDGTRVTIQPNEYFILDTDNDYEINYWNAIKETSIKQYGLYVTSNESNIAYIENLKNVKTGTTASTIVTNDNKVEENTVSVVDSCVSPIAKEIADSINSSVNIPCVQSKEESKYTRESLMSMEKEDLFNICDNFNIKYRKNNSVKTLADLILGSDAI